MDVLGFGVGLLVMWVLVCFVLEDFVLLGVGEVGYIEIWVGFFGILDLVRF